MKKQNTGGMKSKTHGIIYKNKEKTVNVMSLQYIHMGNPAYVQLLNTALVLRYIVIVFKQQKRQFHGNYDLRCNDKQFYRTRVTTGQTERTVERERACVARFPQYR